MHILRSSLQDLGKRTRMKVCRIDVFEFTMDNIYLYLTTFCYMKQMNPLKHTLKEVFVGFLVKGREKHEIHINLKEDLRNKEVEIRCMRIKHNERGLTSNLNLFPDACSVIINNKMIREFTPLHKQSSLKFRRDDPITINRFLVAGHNQISINERF